MSFTILLVEYIFEWHYAHFYLLSFTWSAGAFIVVQLRRHKRKGNTEWKETTHSYTPVAFFALLLSLFHSIEQTRKKNTTNEKVFVYCISKTHTYETERYSCSKCILLYTELAIWFTENTIPYYVHASERLLNNMNIAPPQWLCKWKKRYFLREGTEKSTATTVFISIS